MKKLQFIALFIGILVMCMPIAFAQEMSVTVSGNDNSPGNIRARDTLKVNAVASIPGEDIISKEQLRLYYQDSYAFFDNCTRVGATPSYNCIFADPSFEAYQALQFRIEMRNDDDKVVKSETKNVKVDAIAPEVTTFTVSPNQTISDVTVKYAAQDYGTVFGSIQNCSGIKRVAITLNGNTIAEETGQANTCVQEHQLTLKLNQSGTLCAQAFDLVNQQSVRKCAPIIVDSSAPEILEPAITNNKGISLTHIKKDQPTTATVSVKITDDVGVDKTTVQADLSALSPTLTGFTAPKRAIGDTYVWENVAIVEPTQCKISVKAKDKLGNAAAKDFACTIHSDNVGPAFKGIVSDRQRDNIPLYGRGTPLVLEFEEKDNTGAAGIGLNRNLVYLDLSEIGLNKFTQTDYCEQTDGASWRCTWFLAPPKNTPEGKYAIRIAQGTSDDLDNLLTTDDKSEFTIVFDDTPPAQPTIIDFKIVKGEDTGNITGAVAGNYAQYTVRGANFTDHFANFTDIGAGVDIGTCGVPENETQGWSECVFEKKIELSGPYFAHVDFVFTDDAGNKANTSAEFEVLGVDNSTRSKYWNSRVTCTPSLLNRATASIIPPYITCRVQLTTARTDIKPYLIRGPQDVEECGGDVKNILSDVFTTNSQEGSTNPLVIFKIEAKDYYVNTLNITCPLTVTSKRVVTNNSRQVGYVSPNPQIIRVNLTTQFYNQPQRDMYSEVDRQIEKAMSDGLANANWLTTLRQALYYFELLCRIKTIITSLVSVFQVATAVTKGIADALIATPASGSGAVIGSVSAALCGAKAGTETAYDTIIKVLDLFCFFINCGGTVPGSDRGTSGAEAGTTPAAGTTPPAGGAGATGGTGTPGTPPAAAPTPTPRLGDVYVPPRTTAPRLPDTGDQGVAIAAVAKLPGISGALAAPPATATAPPTAASGGTGAPAQQTSGEKFTSAFSGGANPLCKAIADRLGMAAPNIRDSLFWSVLCLCLPGIVYNVEKLQQVNCYKAVCLHDEVKLNGYPVSYCEETYQYNLCQYVIGQVWAALPFAGLADKITNIIAETISNPVMLITLAAAFVCDDFCETPPNPSGVTLAIFVGCSIAQTLDLIADATLSIYTMARTKDLFQSPSGVYCKRMEKIKKEMDEQKKEKEGRATTNSTGGGK